MGKRAALKMLFFSPPGSSVKNVVKIFQTGFFVLVVLTLCLPVVTIFPQNLLLVTRDVLEKRNIMSANREKQSEKSKGRLAKALLA